MIAKLKESGYKSFEMETAIGNIQFEAFPFQGAEDVKSIADIDGYTTDSDVITGGGQNIYSYASDIVNAEALQRENERRKSRNRLKSRTLLLINLRISLLKKSLPTPPLLRMVHRQMQAA